MALSSSMEEGKGQEEGCSVAVSQRAAAKPGANLQPCHLEHHADRSARRCELLHCLQRAEMGERQTFSRQIKQT